MIWALFPVLGVPLWLIVIGLFATFWNRARVKNAPGVFACMLRAASGTVAGLSSKFPRVSSYAYALWVHDVLIVYSGFALLRSRPLPVAEVKGPLTAVVSGSAKRLGEQPQLLTLRLDEGAIVEVAAAQEDATRLLGPAAPKDEVGVRFGELTGDLAGKPSSNGAG